MNPIRGCGHEVDFIKILAILTSNNQVSMRTVAFASYL